MDCPRCGGSLTQYQLADAETVACDDCIYVGVSVDHTSTKDQRESWSDALERFYQAHSAEQVEEVLDHDAVPVSADVLPVFEAAEEDADDEGDAEATGDEGDAEATDDEGDDEATAESDSDEGSTDEGDAGSTEDTDSTDEDDAEDADDSDATPESEPAETKN